MMKTYDFVPIGTIRWRKIKKGNGADFPIDTIAFCVQITPYIISCQSTFAYQLVQLRFIYVEFAFFVVLTCIYTSAILNPVISF